MKKIFIVILLFTYTVFGWEVNTHRLIDRKAIENASNLILALENMDLSLNSTFDDGYLTYEEHPEYTYFSYITDSSDAMHKIGLTFDDHDIQNLIEAGTVLEDAVWTGILGWVGVNGRFLNHFLNPQDGNDGFLDYSNALDWASRHASNRYNYARALDYFKWAFTGYTHDERMTNQNNRNNRGQVTMTT